MYAIYGNIYHQYTPNVSIYTIHGSYGFGVHFALKELDIESIFHKGIHLGALCQTKKSMLTTSLTWKALVLGASGFNKKWASTQRIKKSLSKGIHFFQRHWVSRNWFACWKHACHCIHFGAIVLYKKVAFQWVIKGYVGGIRLGALRFSLDSLPC